MTFGRSRHTVREGALKQEVGSESGHEVSLQAVTYSVGNSLVKVASARIKATAGRIDLN